jgi:D-alanine-D-alanine ligase
LVVLYGGRSAEHDVSCVTAFHVARVVDRRRYDLRLVGITTGGGWVDASEALERVGSIDRADLPERNPGALPSPDDLLEPREAAVQGLTSLAALDQGSHRGSPPSETERQAPQARPGEDWSAGRSAPRWPPGADAAGYETAGAPIGSDLAAAGNRDSERIVVLPLLHGPMGEDGTLQGLLEILGLPYCGPGVAGSAAAMDKGLTKSILSAAGVPQARHVLLREGDLDEATSGRIGRELGWPVFVKPANMGSSIGISKAVDDSELVAALASAARYDEYLVVEECVKGRELEIGVLGWPTPRTSVAGEVKPSHEFYDYEDKYVDGTAVLDVPADLPDGVAAEMSRLALDACRALRVDSMARVDFFFEEEGRGLLVNEINTIPGFTPISMYPRLWAATGVEYPELIDALVDQALRRAARRSRFLTRRD